MHVNLCAMLVGCGMLGKVCVALQPCNNRTAVKQQQSDWGEGERVLLAWLPHTAGM